MNILFWSLYQTSDIPASIVLLKQELTISKI